MVQKIIQIKLDEKETTTINMAIQQLKKAKRDAKRFLTQCQAVMSEDEIINNRGKITSLEDTLGVLTEMIKETCLIRTDMLDILWSGVCCGALGRWSGFYFHYSDAVRSELKNIIYTGQHLFYN